MLSWRRNQSLAIATAMGLVGEPYISLFNRDIGLSTRQKPALLRALGLVAEPSMNYEVAGFVALFNQKAPLWITTDEGNDWADQAIHARIVIGVQGNGSIDGTLLSIIDPATGTNYQETFRSFATKYERVVGQPTPSKQTSKLRAQIAHF
jgi:Papain-like cysteine protease AvrRpt2